MRSKFILALAAVAVAVIAIAPANAGCNPSKEFALAYYGTDFFINYLPNSNEDVATAVKGHVWQPGSYSTTGDLSAGATACLDETWLLPGAGIATIFGSNGADFGFGLCDTTACPVSGLIILIQTTSLDGQSASFAVGRVVEQFVSPNFDYARTNGDWNMVAIPRPKVTLTAPGSTTPSVNIAVDPPDAAFHSPAADSFQATGTITGYQLVTFTGAADPGREANLWTNLGTALATTSPTATGVTVDCSVPTNHVFIANRPVFDNGQVLGDYVSASVNINCANIANPGSPKIKPIGKKKLEQAQQPQ